MVSAIVKIRYEDILIIINFNIIIRKQRIIKQPNHNHHETGNPEKNTGRRCSFKRI